MRTDPVVRHRTNSLVVYQVQGLLAVNPSRPLWTNVGHSFFRKGGRDGPLFCNTDEGRALLKVDAPAHYYGERFWTDVPAFVSPEAANAFREAAVRGGWCSRAETRVVRYTLTEEVTALPDSIPAKPKHKPAAPTRDQNLREAYEVSMGKARSRPFTLEHFTDRVNQICGCDGAYSHCNCVSVFNRALGELWSEANAM